MIAETSILREEIFAEDIFASQGLEKCEFRGRNFREFKLKGIFRGRNFREIAGLRKLFSSTDMKKNQIRQKNLIDIQQKKVARF